MKLSMPVYRARRKRRILVVLDYAAITNPVAIRECSFRIAAVRTGEAEPEVAGRAERPRATAFVASSQDQA
jgi:hypothetical protein